VLWDRCLTGQERKQLGQERVRATGMYVVPGMDRDDGCTGNTVSEGSDLVLWKVSVPPAMTSGRAEMRLKSSHHTEFIVAEIFDFPAYQRGDRTVVRLADGESGLSDGRSGSAGFRSVGRDGVVHRLSCQEGEQLGQFDMALGGPVGHEFGKDVASCRGQSLDVELSLVGEAEPADFQHGVSNVPVKCYEAALDQGVDEGGEGG
jgi:hypothetical protein